MAKPEEVDGGYYLFFQRSCTDSDSWQPYVAFAPQACGLETLVGVASSHWAIEYAFEAAK